MLKKRISLPEGMSAADFCCRLLFFAALLLIIMYGARYGVSYYGRIKERNAELSSPYNELAALHGMLSLTKPGEWLYDTAEFGQTFEDFQNSNPPRMSPDRHTIYLQPVGKLQFEWASILNITKDYLEAFFCTDVVILQPIPANLIPPDATREHPDTGTQFLTTFITGTVLPRHRPADAFVHVGFTQADLWPGRNWNFVFGQADSEAMSGVWSFHRLGSPDLSIIEYEIALKRALRVASHEIGHLYGLRHATAYQSLMNGSGSLEEADTQPLHLGPLALQKLMSALNCSLEGRFTKLEAFYRSHNMSREAEFVNRSLQILSGASPG